VVAKDKAEDKTAASKTTTLVNYLESWAILGAKAGLTGLWMLSSRRQAIILPEEEILIIMLTLLRMCPSIQILRGGGTASLGGLGSSLHMSTQKRNNSSPNMVSVFLLKQGISQNKSLLDYKAFLGRLLQIW
jgi:hypothetical protein